MAVDLHYGNTDVGVFKRGVQNLKYFCLRINRLKGNYWILRIGCLNWYSSMKKKLRNIRMIFDVENRLWSQILVKFWYSPLTQFSKFNNFLWVCWFLGKNISNFVPLIWKLHNPYCHNLHNHIQLLLRGVDAHIGRDKKREFLMTPIVKISNLGHYKKFMETIIQRTFHCYTTHYQFHPCSSARAAALYVCAW